MFKKKESVVLAPAHLVSGADRKKLARRLEGLPGMPEGVTAGDLLPKGRDLAVARFAAPSRAQLYTLGGEPAWLDARLGRPDDLTPSVFALWRLPDLLPRVVARHSAVSHFLVGGADLMLPGVDISSLPDIARGQLCSVSVPGNPAPFAVGRALLSSEEARRQPQGRLLELLHVFGDYLWGLAPGGPVPNAGFDVAAGCVLPLVGTLEGNTQERSVMEAPAANAAGGHSTTEVDTAELQQRFAAMGTPHSGGHPATGADAETEVAEPGDPVQSLPAASEAVSAADMDQRLQASLLQALHRTVKNSSLPMPASVLWGGHLLPARRAEWKLELKTSSHRKISKFLQAFGPVGAKLLSLREEKFSGETVVTAVDRCSALYTAFRPWPVAASAAAAPRPVAPAEPEEEPGRLLRSQPEGVATELALEELYKSPAATSPIFKAVDVDPAGLFTAQEAGIAVITYAKKHGLEQGASSQAHLLLDSTLCDALFKGLLKKGDAFPTEIAKAQLREAFLNRMLPQTRLTRGCQQAVRKGALQHVQISVEKRQGNKKVTRIIGAETFLLDAALLAGDVAKRFACAAHANLLPGAKAQGTCEIVMQGDVATRVGTYLAERWSVPKKFILVKAAKK